MSWTCWLPLVLRVLLVTLALGAYVRDAAAAALPAGFTETSIGGLSQPTAMAIAPDGRIFVCEKGGALRVIKDGVLLPAPFVSLTVDTFSERGLLGVAFDPAFASNGFVYVYYTTTAPIHNRVSRFTANGDVAAGNGTPILDLPAVGPGNHNGGAIHFGPDGKLYVAVGEHANTANSQDKSNLLGKILRLNPDGSAAPGNPFAGESGADPRVWALGLRNPFTFAFNPANGQMFINDVGSGGPNVFEEINDGIIGANYGWPIEEGIPPTPSAVFTRPRFAYDHSDGSCAITGGAFYFPAVSQFPGQYAGGYFFADLCGGWIKRLDLDSDTVTDFATGIAGPVDIQVGSDGSLYYLSIFSGTLTRVQYGVAGVLPVAPIMNTPLTNGGAFRLSWTASSGATSYVLEVGDSSATPTNVLVTNVGGTTSLEGIAPAGSYSVRVRAVNAVGPSDPSNSVGVIVTVGACANPPQVPTEFKALTAGLSVLLSWDKAFTATSYVLEAGSVSGGADVLIANVGNVTSLGATGPPNTYFTRIRAANACGVSAPSNEVPVVLTCNVTAPTGLVATRTGAIVTFTWTGSPGATGYRAQVGSAPGLSNLLNVPLGTGTSVSIGTSGVAPGTYYVRMVAITTCGASGPSNEATVTVP